MTSRWKPTTAAVSHCSPLLLSDCIVHYRAHIYCCGECRDGQWVDWLILTTHCSIYRFDHADSTCNPDFQSRASYGHDQYTYKKIEIRCHLVQKIEWKQTDGHNPIWLPSCYTHTPVQRPFVRDNPVGRYQKGKTNLDFTEARDSQWQWHQLGHVQVCTSLQADNHASSPPLSFFTGRMPFLPPNQQCQSTECKLYKKLRYRRVTARCVLSVVILPITMQQCRNYLYNKSWPNRWYEVGGLVGGNMS